MTAEEVQAMVAKAMPDGGLPKINDYTVHLYDERDGSLRRYTIPRYPSKQRKREMSTKLSVVQQLIVHQMQNGWDLGFYEGLYPTITLQEGGIGRGGATRQVTIPTFSALRRHGIIEEKERRYPVTIYTLTEATDDK